MKNQKLAEKHPPEKAIFMNMCMLCDGDMVLARLTNGELDRDVITI